MESLVWLHIVGASLLFFVFGLSLVVLCIAREVFMGPSSYTPDEPPFWPFNAGPKARIARWIAFGDGCPGLEFFRAPPQKTALPVA